jgi:hypothetical protein
VRDGRKKDELGAVGMEEARADTAVLMRSTRDSRLQSDHVNEPDFDEKAAEGETPRKRLGNFEPDVQEASQDSPAEAFALAMRCKTK